MSREIPKVWVEKLFAKMASIYGAPFVEMWRGADPDEFVTTWQQGLSAASVTDDGLKRGVAALFRTRKPPNLPEFIELCALPAAQRQNTLALDAPRTSPEEARRRLAILREQATSLLKQFGAPAGGGIRWAYRLLQRSADGEPITPHQIAFAKEAIEAYNGTHGTSRPREPEVALPPRVPSPHIYEADREPGSDDE